MVAATNGRPSSRPEDVVTSGLKHVRNPYSQRVRRPRKPRTSGAGARVAATAAGMAAVVTVSVTPAGSEMGELAAHSYTLNALSEELQVRSWPTPADRSPQPPAAETPPSTVLARAEPVDPEGSGTPASGGSTQAPSRTAPAPRTADVMPDPFGRGTEDVGAEVLGPPVPVRGGMPPVTLAAGQAGPRADEQAASSEVEPEGLPLAAALRRSDSTVGAQDPDDADGPVAGARDGETVVAAGAPAGERPSGGLGDVRRADRDGEPTAGPRPAAVLADPERAPIAREVPADVDAPNVSATPADVVTSIPALEPAVSVTPSVAVKPAGAKTPANSATDGEPSLDREPSLDEYLETSQAKVRLIKGDDPGPADRSPAATPSAPADPPAVEAPPPSTVQEEDVEPAGTTGDRDPAPVPPKSGRHAAPTFSDVPGGGVVEPTSVDDGPTIEPSSGTPVRRNREPIHAFPLSDAADRPVTKPVPAPERAVEPAPTAVTEPITEPAPEPVAVVEPVVERAPEPVAVVEPVVERAPEPAAVVAPEATVELAMVESSSDSASAVPDVAPSPVAGTPEAAPVAPEPPQELFATDGTDPAEFASPILVEDEPAPAVPATS